MHKSKAPIAAILVCLIVSFSFTAKVVLAQDVQTDRSSINVLFTAGTSGENYSSVQSFVRDPNPDSGLGLNLTVKSGALSEHDLNGVKLLLLWMPNATTISNATLLRMFLDSGSSLFILSNYYGGGAVNSSYVLNGILNEVAIGAVDFNNDTFFFDNSTSDWQSRVYNNNSFAVRVNSSMIEFKPAIQLLANGVNDLVTLSCSLNVTDPNAPAILGTASAPTNSTVANWLALLSNETYRIAFCGSASMFNNTYLNVEDNQNLFRNIVIWLVEQFQKPKLDLFPLMVLASSAILVSGILVYVISTKRKS